jgi:hypothetical protein
MFVPRYTAGEAREAIAASYSYAEALRRLGLCATGGNWKVLRRWAEEWSISTAHFDPHRANRQRGRRRQRPLEEVLVPGSSYSRAQLKRRLLASGLKDNRCELCDQGPVWRDRRMSLILDHVNGISDDNRLENLRIVCPNCAATLDTHCARNGRRRQPRPCEHCGEQYLPTHKAQRYCSLQCSAHSPARQASLRPAARKVERPPYEQIVAEIEATGYLAVGRKYGVSDNAIRKWVLAYQREREEREELPGTRRRRA